MDGDALIIPQKRLMWILDRIKEHLPWVKRVGAYANTKSISLKSPQELSKLRETGGPGFDRCGSKRGGRIKTGVDAIVLKR